MLFVDAGDTFTADPLLGAGVVLLVFSGLARSNLAKGIHPDRGARFDLLFRAAR